MMDFNTDLTDITNAGIIKNTTKSITMNEAGIDLLATETMQTAMIANDYLNKIVVLVDKTKEYFQCEAGDELRRKFSELSAEFPVVIQNIENYAYSLKKAKEKKLESVQNAVIDLKQATMNVQDLIK